MPVLRSATAFALCLSISACDTGAPTPPPTSGTLPTVESVEPAQSVRPPATRAQVSFRNGRVSVTANDTPQLALLAQLAKQAGFGLDLFHRDWASVTLSFSNVPLETALGYILAGTPYEVLYNSSLSGPPSVDRVRVGESPLDNEYREKALVALSNKGFNVTPLLDMAVSTDQVLALSDQEKIALLAHLPPSEQNLPVLLDFLGNYADTEVRISAMAALENADSPQALEAIVEVLKDPDPQMVLAAIDSIEFAGGVEQIFALEALSQHPSPSVQRAANEAIDFLR